MKYFCQVIKMLPKTYFFKKITLTTLEVEGHIDDQESITLVTLIILGTEGHIEDDLGNSCN